jgi:prepilin-type N-terminal cleavage/methylation domain-containing protein
MRMRLLDRRSSGFTLIELLIVVIIVAVLAAVGVPLLSANVNRARMTEAEAGLGAIRTAMRAYYAENEKYPTLAAKNPIEAGITIKPEDLNGQFFQTVDYKITSSATEFCVEVNGSQATGPGEAKVEGLERSMNQDGTIKEGLCS